MSKLKVLTIEGEPLDYALDEDGKIYDLIDTATKVNEQVDEINELKKILERVLHEFNGIHGLYASDNKEMLQPFQLNYQDLIKLLEEVIEDE